MTTVFSCLSNIIKDGDGACDIPSVEPLASTSLTCHFNEDLNQTKSRFDVYLTKGVIQQSLYSYFMLYMVLDILCLPIFHVSAFS